jgi:Rieske Fe-S protein
VPVLTRREACTLVLKCLVAGGFFHLTWKYVQGRGASSLEVAFSERPGQGEVIFSQGVYLVGLEKEIKALSARCPHLGCQLAYHSMESRFKCPCHGSQFSLKGDLLKGPARKEMTALDLRSDDKCGIYKAILPLS